MKEIVKEVAKKLNMNAKDVDNIYKAYWYFIRETIENLPLKEIESEEEFSALRTSFNLPYLGKLYCIWKSRKNQEKYIKTYGLKHKKDKTDV